ncbi:hypothetical protein GHT07_02265 [Caenimonas koreensis DSM 17982]|uniref:Uncharacterized protein n=1 Tax=Caenimonas koreensis DSM 17982 TaxID=1121255 RepID=A0A844B3G2_9BURK|nr:hypothetical protein [Caenimonas koreensis]MRD46087.1 hypothetical protein [Caenimonas koreensis DSM 17982]
MSTDAVFPAVLIAAVLALGFYFDSTAVTRDEAAVAAPMGPRAVTAGAKNENGAEAPK